MRGLGAEPEEVDVPVPLVTAGRDVARCAERLGGGQHAGDGERADYGCAGFQEATTAYVHAVRVRHGCALRQVRGVQLV
ncbi:hypothetical protein GCM10010431_15590 [Streptomyces kunmingensis]